MTTSFKKMSGLTWADCSQVNGFDAADAKEEKVNARIAEAMKSDPRIRATCPVCRELWEGTFEQVTQHIEACSDATG